MRRAIIGLVAAIFGLALPACEPAHAQFATFSQGGSTSLVANRTGFSSRSVQNTGTTGGGTATQVQQWQGIYTMAATTKLYFLYANYRSDPTTPSTLDTGESAVTIRMGVKTASGVYIQAHGPDGSIDMTLQPGTMGIMTATGNFAVGRQRIQQRVSWASATTYWPAIDIIMSNGADEFNEFGTALTDRTVATSWPGGTRTTNYSILPPVAVFANLAVPLPGVMIIGDSVTIAGNNDSTFGNYIGYVQRGLAAQVPWMLNGATGMSISAFMSNSTQVGIRFTKLLGMHPGIAYALDALGTNDLVASQTSAQMLTYLGTMKSDLLPYNVRTVPTRLQPRTNSANNAVPTGFPNAFTTRASYNASIVSANGVGWGYLDAAASFQDTSDNDLWRTDLGTPTSDGIHPATVLHTQGTSDFGAVVPTLFPAL